MSLKYYKTINYMCFLTFIAKLCLLVQPLMNN